MIVAIRDYNKSKLVYLIKYVNGREVCKQTLICISKTKAINGGVVDVES